MRLFEKNKDENQNKINLLNLLEKNSINNSLLNILYSYKTLNFIDFNYTVKT
ncbi:hypothetical protein NWQ33_03775 [Mycoplasmopsis cynos]|nr:hypothetical protein [Mycoplasmopsis cynos]